MGGVGWLGWGSLKGRVGIVVRYISGILYYGTSVSMDGEFGACIQIEFLF